MSSIVKDIFEGVENTVKGAFDGDIGSIVALGAMAYGGYSLYSSMPSASGAATVTNIAGESASTGVMGGAEAATTGVMKGAETAFNPITSSASNGLLDSAVSESTFLEPLTTNVNTGLLEGATQNVTANGLLDGATNNIMKDVAEKSFLDSPWLAPAAIVGGNVLASGISAAEQRRIEEQRIKERNQEQSGGYTRSGEGNIDLKLGSRASNITGSYRSPETPGKYKRI